MLQFLPVYKRELKAYFQSASTYVILALYFLFFGLAYHDLMVQLSQLSLNARGGGLLGQSYVIPNINDAIVRTLFRLMISLVMFTIPILSMRLIAEEKNKGTFELLVSSPIGDWSILLGKYFALVTVGLVMTLLSSIYPLLTEWVAPDPSGLEWPVIMTCGIGLLLMFAAFAAFGVMASAFTAHQMTAAIVTMIGLILWQIGGELVTVDIPWLREVARDLSAFNHTENFINGVLSFRDLAYFFLMSFLFLFIASKTLDARRWRI